MLLNLTLLDWILILVMVLYAIGGYSRGFFLTLGSVVGFALGAVAAFYLTPLVVSMVGGGWRILVAVLSVVGLIGLGQALGLALGRPLRRLSDRTGLGLLERLAGAVLNVATCALVIVVLSFSVGQLGVASITRVLGDSRVVTSLEGFTPDPVREGIARARAAVLAQSGIPELSERLFPAESAPTQTLENPALDTAADSVVRVSGTAEACLQNQTGSGFVVAPGMVVTNAHVVAGVEETTVETRTGSAYAGTVVHYDAATDLAVISAPDLPAAALSTGPDAAAGDLVEFMGYPLGGPFASRTATVQGLSETRTRDADGNRAPARQIYQLAADVQQGNSGGPLLNSDGQVIGVIFAKAEQGETGYALSLAELRPVLDALGTMSAPVGTGTCHAG